MKTNIDIVTGFLEEGKTTFIRELLNSKMIQPYEKVLLIVCEEGFEEYDGFQNQSAHLNIKYIQDKQYFEHQFLVDIQTQSPDYILVEYNGTWLMDDVLTANIPRHCEIRNVITLSDCSVFERYLKNMSNLLWDKLSSSDIVIFNRFQNTPETRRKAIKKVIKNINKNTEIVFEQMPLEHKAVADNLEPYLRVNRFNFLSVLAVSLFLFLIIKNIELFDNSYYVLLQKVNTVFISILIQAIPFVLLGTLFSALLGFFVSDQMVLKLISKVGIVSYPLAAIAGIIFPMCDCGMVPICKGLLKKGVSLSKVMIFLLASQAVNPIVILSTWVAFSGQLKVVLIRTLSGIFIAMILGIFIERLNITIDDVKNDGFDNLGFGNGDLLELNLKGKWSKVQRVFQQMGIEFFRVGKYIVVGAFICAFVQTLVPKTVFTTINRFQGIQVIIMLLISSIMSVCSTSNAFIAKSFYPTFGLNSVLGFTVMGPMLDITNLMMLSDMLKWKFIMVLVTALLLIGFVVFTLLGFVV